MESLVQVLYLLSSGLLIPVIAVLFGFLVWLMVEIGRFLRELRERSRLKSNWRSFLLTIQKQSSRLHQSDVTAFFKQDAYPGLLGSFAAKGKKLYHGEPHLSNLAAELEIEAAGRIARMNLGVRIGPMLGLMGTLIPLGPALVGLSTGDIETLTQNLVVAFSTTVLGLFVGGICYALLLVRRQWYAQDIANIDYLCHCLFADEMEGGTQDVVNKTQPRKTERPLPSTAANSR